ncbi:PCYCGC motif-containing (lipo)protein [Virgibacillus sp. 179-BFC.A HS]|uniref:PCYCGC motif-containing (Lipo)protein n=1 Tax=Tigheibacillus jepli TaxID=3035914 RepID=A0ABU5CFW9_9BACI|nr:PCYCGC motif-containing (lipo)protein [Virgibacillus sp. 179-BFC.A HS]MDY0405181.1 PCYCGC motif-containing (lipo)protein [Virgibacillus sp. 179-BFC.A HS]
MRIACILLLTLLAACSGNGKDSQSGHADHNPRSGDLWQTTASNEELPKFLDESDDNMQTLYLAVAQHKNLLEQIPCYCGCGNSADHKNNYDCFIHENNGKKVTWDDHATRCQACLDIAAESIIQYQEGTSVKDIRKTIDEKYQEGYADPTPTPEI